MSHGYRSEMLMTFNDDPYLLKKVVRPIPMEASRRTKTEKARKVRSNVKVLLTLFFDCNGVVHNELLPQSHTVNKEYNLEVMR